MDYSRHTTNRVETPQTKKVPGVKKQKRNNAGGVSFKISKWDYLMRFLILGTEGGTYYVSEKELTVKACDNVQKCIDTDGKKTVDKIVEVSLSGRSANNDAAIFALAMAASCKNLGTRNYALSHLDSVCRIGTHLFHFVKFVKTMRGFGRSLKNAIADWYTKKPVEKLAYQMLKYQGRDGWTHRDVLRLSHPEAVNKDMNLLFKYAVGKRNKIPRVSDYAIGMEEIKHVKKVTDVHKIIKECRLTREAVPTNYLNSYAVWEALLETMPIGALVRNLGKMASLNMHKPFSDTLEMTVTKLTDEIAISKSRIHPLNILNAMMIYANECGMRGSLRWEVSATVIEALEDAFYKSFKYVEATNKRIMLALDISGSMTSYKIANSVLDCREASGCMAMVSMRTEPNTFVTGFTSSGKNVKSLDSNRFMWGRSISELNISPKQTLYQVLRSISSLDFGATDCALPMLYAKQRDIDVDAIIIYTDNETWAGDIHPWQALDQLQDHLGHEVKCVVVGMVGTKYSIAKPDYPNMIDFAGFDVNAPAAISEFIKL